jgi:hypothetical protein
VLVPAPAIVLASRLARSSAWAMALYAQ